MWWWNCYTFDIKWYDISLSRRQCSCGVSRVWISYLANYERWISLPEYFFPWETFVFQCQSSFLSLADCHKSFAFATRYHITHFSSVFWKFEVSSQQELLLGSALSSLQVYLSRLQLSASNMHLHLYVQPFRNPIFVCICPKMMLLKSFQQSERRTNTFVGHQQWSFKPCADIWEWVD